jgi:hypothetical protein
MALDSVMDHDLDTAEFLDTEAAAVEDGFDQFADWCAAMASCALHGQDVGADWDELVHRATPLSCSARTVRH